MKLLRMSIRRVSFVFRTGLIPNTVFLIISSLVLFGCASAKPKTKLEKDTKVCISMRTDELLNNRVVTADAVEVFANRIQNQLIGILDSRGIKSSLTDAATPEDAKLTVTLDTIESSTEMKEAAPFTFTAAANTQYEVKYSATLLSQDHIILLKMKGREEHRSLDSLTRIIGQEIGKHVAKCYK